ncbi:hypothetical protein EG329_011247 [Mollisiaceae sp. DMI_Dod_QoI]|nr:hypothetical protein EG329_011247 [Helotiales sp. DMI_Dod_QoI]
MAPQDSFIDDDEESCPLCVEEFDLSDKNFRPCPCGYQICQFCFNNIRQNLNGLCPACRRPYDDKTIEWKVVTPEEIARFKAETQKKAKKNQEQRQKEAQKREVENLNRKHLSGLRVLQKNLVYVVGLSPGIPEQEILSTLRGDRYFGQYGKIVKIVVSNKKTNETGPNGQSLGVYVTFARNEDAARCIAAVNGSQNGDRVLRAQLGTTKYCSAYLRNETCTNKNCMFLHEPGDNNDSYSRQDLSSLNSVNTQRPLAATASASASTSSRQAAQVQAPIPQAQPVAAASQPMARDNSKEGSDSGDGSALPSSASWANKGIPQRSRRGSVATSGATSSPAFSQAIPATTEVTGTTQEQSQEPSGDAVAPSDETSASQPPRLVRDPILINLLRAINSSEVSYSRCSRNTEPTFPPLFDNLGGEKRRVMREGQQEEARLQVEQDSLADMHSVAEALEEEAPESGSLQLGGEPEDRHDVRDSNLPMGFGRRPSTQLPIQRASNGGPFGPSLSQNFPQNLNNLSSINGRTLTPQQLDQLRLGAAGQSQSPGFMDQYPPGMRNQLGQGSALFQQQGHNRQSSRYSFANDGSSSSSSVKPSANPKLMAQQSSMMPSAGSQFYGSSMPGPPPGLKSSGTPPIGGMFGQGHGFGGSMGGNPGFGLAKENSSDMLREMLRSRGAPVGGQSHDTGKREYFPSFLQQYPSASSTPAPASGLLASLYGPQTGAFHDFGQKQKKKGKKHRHANTSSSGGGGLVDLADPSILQARMQHQQQSNAGVGQGLFGGQAQDDQSLLSLDEASVDALVADSCPDDFVVPAIPDIYDKASRASTPSVPPGLGLSHAHPPLTASEDILTKPMPQFLATATSFQPSRSTAFSPRTVTPLANVVTLPVAPSPQASENLPVETSIAQAKQDVQKLATNTGLSKAIASQSSQPSLKSEDFPALESGKNKAVTAPVSAKNSATTKPTPITLISKKSATPSSTTQVTQPTPKAVERRSAAGLSVSVPAKSTIKTSVGPATPSKSAVPPSAFPALPANTVSTASVQSPSARNPPRTLRLTSTPKTETPTVGSATPSSVTSIFPPQYPPSRQPSLSSVTRIDRPGTPTSEMLSDTSASMSRASSPPPSKIGSAPVRTVTKSAQKKHRKEAQKEKEKAELDAAAAKTEPEPEIAPVVGRKKKVKKERTIHSAAGGSTPAVSRPPSPGPSESLVEEEKMKEETTEQTVKVEDKVVVTDPEPPTRNPPKTQDSKGKGKAKAPPQPSPEPAPVPSEVEDEMTNKPTSTPASVLKDLISSGFFEDPTELALFKNLPVSYRNADPVTENPSFNQKLTITPEDRATLLSGQPVHKVTEASGRIMLTPNGDCVRNLTEEEEKRYLELQARIAEQSGATAFVSSRHHAGNGFALIEGRAVPNGPPSFFPMLNTGTAPMDPVGKINRDEALSYINQYVLPSLSTSMQLEQALNTNALNAEMMRSGASAAWTSWGTDPATPHLENSEGSYGPTNREGMIATGLESMTAQFAIGGDMTRNQPSTVSLLSLPESETAMQHARKDAEVLEKRLNALIKKNRRIMLGSNH